MCASHPPIILASNSPRRKELLQLLRIPFTIHAVETDESLQESDPSSFVQTLAKQKAQASWKDYAQDGLYIGADTIVVQNQSIFGKPKNKKEAVDMIAQLQGSQHQVYTGLCLFNSVTQETFSDFSCTTVWVHSMSEAEITDYVNLNESLDKAGGYGIQGAFAVFIDRIEGCYYNIMGLPVSKLYQMLTKIS